MTHPSWGELRDYHCSQRTLRLDNRTVQNPYYEDMADRRYNYSAASDTSASRLVFLKGVLSNPTNKTLQRHGRFIWCRNVQYAGRSSSGLRQLSFTVDSGSKRFVVTEDNVVCVPSNAFINNSRYFRESRKTFLGFASVFSYTKSIASMAKNMKMPQSSLRELLDEESPFKPGALVSPRLGYFFPEILAGNAVPEWNTPHPCGLILGPSVDSRNYMGRELYRVRFGATTYENVNVAQMEILNEI